MNVREKEIYDLIREWAEHGLKPFVGQERTPEIDKAVRQMFRMAFSAGKQVIEGLGGQKFGVTFDKEAGRVDVHLGEIPDGALIIEV